MKPHKFIDLAGIDRAKRVVENVVCDAEFYSYSTGSYYSTDKNDSVKIRDLKNAISEYKLLILARDSYATRLRHWESASQ